MTREIFNIENALREFLIQAKQYKNYNLKRYTFFNNHRYVLVHFIQKTVIFTFKRDLFLSYGKIHLGYDCAGESINKEVIDYAKEIGITEIYIMHKSGTAYETDINQWLSGKIHINAADQKTEYLIAVSSITPLNKLENINHSLLRHSRERFSTSFPLS